MQAELSRFQLAVEEQPELATAIRSLTTAESLVAYANEQGFDFTSTELEAWVRRGELLDAELESVAGGTSSYEQARAAGVPTLQALYWSLVLKE